MPRPIPFTRVKIESPFWDPIIQVSRDVSLPLILSKLKSYGTWEAMRLKWKHGDPGVTPDILWDSDIGKYVEAASYALYHEPNLQLEESVNEAIANIIDAQQNDGYIGIYHTVVAPGKRWSSLAHNLELYGGGHILEAAITRHIATGSPKDDQFLRAMQKYVDLVKRDFGHNEGQRLDYPGHQEIELALMRLYDLTGDQSAVNLVKFFIDERGRTDPPRKGHAWDLAAIERGDDPETFFPYYWPKPRCYWHMQAHLPLTEQQEIVGHSVQAVYWLSSIVDLAVATGERSYLEVVERLWQNMVDKKMYVTGGIGSVHIYEGFGAEYDLPNETSYAETCAAVGTLFLAQRLLKVRCDTAITDIMETVLYNAMLAGISLDGKSFNYDNPLATVGCGHSRREWFKVFCCPSNICRLLNSLGGYLYAEDEDEGDGIERLTIHLYVTSEVKLRASTWRIDTEWPWEGKTTVRMLLGEGRPVILRLRIPSWSTSHEITLNGETITPTDITAGYATLPVANYSSEDRLVLLTPFSGQLLTSHPLVHQNRDCMALRRGPVIYALESIDQDQRLTDLRLARLDPGAPLKDVEMQIGGKQVVAIETKGSVLVSNRDAASAVRAVEVDEEWEVEEVRLKFVPYFSWGNRGPSDVRIWIPIVK